jgi:Holliday junction DNA helicase RuvA
MIGKLRGLVDSVEEDGFVIDVGGVGYLVAASARTLGALPSVGEPAELWIETQMREDAIRLYGFLIRAERDWFRLLQSVQGVGGKLALAILGALSVETLANAIARQDRATMARAPGVGAKLAARLVLELKDKAPALGAVDFGPADLAAPSPAGLPKAAEDAILALVALGYARAQAAAAIVKCSAELGGEAQTVSLVRAGLRELAQ